MNSQESRQQPEQVLHEKGRNSTKTNPCATSRLQPAISPPAHNQFSNQQGKRTGIVYTLNTADFNQPSQWKYPGAPSGYSLP